MEELNKGGGPDLSISGTIPTGHVQGCDSKPIPTGLWRSCWTGRSMLGKLAGEVPVDI